VSARRSDLWLRVAAGLIGLVAALALTPARAEMPARVVSLNVCTDQLAVMLAAPGQIAAVSRLSMDPRSSAIVEQARDLPKVATDAEQIFLLRPDLVLAGRYTERATVSMLRRLGVRVETFDHGSTLADIRRDVTRMGTLLGRADRAAQVLAEFDAALARLRPPPDADRPRSVTYGANGWTAGQSGLSAEILRAAGHDNAALAAGFPFGGHLPLEVLVLTAPDFILTPSPYPGGSRAEDAPAHPAVDRISGATRLTLGMDQHWTCATPHIITAVAALRRAADEAGR